MYKNKVILVPGRPGKSREGPGKVPGRDLETLKVPWSRGPGTKEVQKSRDSPASLSGQDFVNKVQN